jgi:hypothetical protein
MLKKIIILAALAVAYLAGFAWSQTNTPTSTATRTATATATATPTATQTLTFTMTYTSTPTLTATFCLTTVVATYQYGAYSTILLNSMIWTIQQEVVNDPAGVGYSSLSTVGKISAIRNRELSYPSRYPLLFNFGPPYDPFWIKDYDVTVTANIR